MRVRLIGANPFLTLYSGGAATAFASVWRVDWSERGAGAALVYGDRERVRVIGPDPALGMWLAETFNRHFVDVCADLPWRRPEATVAPVNLELDLAQGMRASADDITVELGDILDRRLTRREDYPLGGETNVLSTVWMPCGSGAITRAGQPIPGSLKRTSEPLYSSAAIAESEVWCHPE